MDECEERWENGISGVDIENISSVVRIRPEHNCRLKYGSQYFLIKTDRMRKDEFLEQIPLINERPREPGYYTWIVWSNGLQPQFTCCKTYSILEMGTIHIAIAFRVNARKIHAAGEILAKDDGSLFFNFFSGTFMLKEFAPGGKRRARCSGDDLENFLIEKMQEILGADATWSSREFIRFGENLQITEQELEFYRSFGAEVQLFDEQSPCYDARNIEGGKRRGKRKTKKRANKKYKKITHRRKRRGGSDNSSKAIVIVEPRAHKLLKSVIENFDELMDKSWDLYVFHGKSHEKYAKESTNTVKGRKVYLLPLETDNLTADEYNALFRKTSFWNKVNAENILVFQTDTFLCKESLNKINDFMKFDYIGCPFDEVTVGKNANAPYWGGEPFYGIGGLSFRKKQFMMDCINKNKDSTAAEDVLFSKCVNDFSQNKPTAEDMNNFCTQHKYVKNSFGVHKTHLNLHDKKDMLYQYCPVAKKMEETFDNKDKTIDIVIARYEEDLSWLENLEIKYSKIYIYNKGSNFKIPNISNIHVIKLPNLGRESHTYLYHVIKNYNNLADMTFFLPGSVWKADFKRVKFLKLIDSIKNDFISTIVGDVDKEANNKLKDFQIEQHVITNEDNRKKNPDPNLQKSKYRPFGKWFEKHFPGEKLSCITYNSIMAVTPISIHKRPLNFYKTLLDEHSLPNPEVGHYSERSWEKIFSIDKCV